MTSLCHTNDSEFHATENTEKSQNKTNDDDDKNPFTIPVALLLYKVAKNMKNSSKEQIEAKQAGSIRALLENCIKLLPKEQYPQIVTSSYYLLSDLFIPAGINPNSPSFVDDVESESIYDDEEFDDVCSNSER